MIEHGDRRLIVDISADFRHQMLRERVNRIDALLITHCHADHVFGLDDIRPFNFQYGPLPVHASESTWRQLRKVFYYIFESRHIGGGLPQITPHTIDEPFEVCGLWVTPFPVIHGKGEVTGFRFSDGVREAAFVTDCNIIPEQSLQQMLGLDLLIIDALRYKPHPTHLHMEQTLAYIDRLKPAQALLTHIGHDINFADASRHLPDGVALAWDGLKIDLD